MAKIEALFCPACGGQADLEEGAQRGQCRSCQATLALPAPSGCHHYFVEPRIGRNAALSIAATATDLPVETISAHLLFVPFWSISAESFGFVAGQRPIKPVVIQQSSDGGSAIPPEIGQTQNLGGEVVKKSLWLEQEFRAPGVKWPDLAGLDIHKRGELRLQPAADENLSNRGIRIEPHDLPPEFASREASAYFRGHLLFPYGEYPILHAAVTNLKTTRRLIYYPVWRVWGFTAQGRLKCVVDAVNGARLTVRQYSRPRPAHPTRYLAAALAGSLILSMVYAPATGYDLRIAAGTLILVGVVWTGVLLKNYTVDRVAGYLCRMIWRV